MRNKHDRRTTLIFLLSRKEVNMFVCSHQGVKRFTKRPLSQGHGLARYLLYTVHPLCLGVQTELCFNGTP